VTVIVICSELLYTPSRPEFRRLPLFRNFHFDACGPLFLFLFWRFSEYPRLSGALLADFAHVFEQKLLFFSPPFRERLGGLLSLLSLLLFSSRYEFPRIHVSLLAFWKSPPSTINFVFDQRIA